MSLPDRFTDPIKRVSIVIPMFNESRHIEALVSNIAEQDFTGEVETIVADGRSTDDSVRRVREAATRAGILVTVIDNPQRWVSTGLNSCIRQATGDLIVRLDCHTRYPTDYVTQLVNAAQETGAASVGGLAIPVGRTRGERAVASAMDSPFGGVHWSRHAGNAERVEVDVIYVGSYRPPALKEVGLFDESLVRNQDDELSFRIRRAGGRIILDPAIRGYYTPRGSYGAVFRQYYEYGLWKIPVMLRHRQVTSARSLAPLALVTSLVTLGLAAGVSPRARALLRAEAIGYSLSALAFALAAARRRQESLRVVPRVALVFPTFHLAYGIGLVRGLVNAVGQATTAKRASRLDDASG
jgi:succinoglycan biosynthesis protein ExoA